MQSKTREQLVKMYLDALKENKIPWRERWYSDLNKNGVTNTEYRGVNQLILSYVAYKEKYKDNRWLTYKQIKENNYKISKAVGELSIKLNREPTIEEIAEKLEMSSEEIIMTMEANIEVESIHKTIYQNDGNEIYLVDKISKDGISNSIENINISEDTEKDNLINHMVLKEIIEKLDPREKELIILRYYKDKTQVEVAKVLGISQVQVSRMEKKILLKMRKNLF